MKRPPARRATAAASSLHPRNPHRGRYDFGKLVAACAEVEGIANQSGLELRRLWGEQDIAFTYTLPLGRGVR